VGGRVAGLGVPCGFLMPAGAGGRAAEPAVIGGRAGGGAAAPPGLAGAGARVVKTVWQFVQRTGLPSKPSPRVLAPRHPGQRTRKGMAVFPAFGFPHGRAAEPVGVLSMKKVVNRPAHSRRESVKVW
jgi:hypothetical protein